GDPGVGPLARVLLELRIELLDELPSPARELLHVLRAASHGVVRGIHHARRFHRLPPTHRLELVRARPMPVSEHDGPTAAQGRRGRRGGYRRPFLYSS